MFSLPRGLLLLTAMLQDVSPCSRAGVWSFDWLQLEFFDKEIWVCFIGGCTAEAEMSFSWLLWKWAGFIRPSAELGKLICPEDLRMAK